MHVDKRIKFYYRSEYSRWKKVQRCIYKLDNYFFFQEVVLAEDSAVEPSAGGGAVASAAVTLSEIWKASFLSLLSASTWWISWHVLVLVICLYSLVSSLFPKKNICLALTLSLMFSANFDLFHSQRVWKEFCILNIETYRTNSVNHAYSDIIFLLIYHLSKLNASRDL